MKLRTRQQKTNQEEGKEESEAPVTTKKQQIAQTKEKVADKPTANTRNKKAKARRQSNKIYTFARMQRIYKAFFETYAMGQTMTKGEREAFLQSIGEKESRKFTYRLQNYKDRCADEAKAYKRLFDEGRIHNYESFLTYLFNNDVPELNKSSPGHDSSVPDAQQQQQEE